MSSSVQRDIFNVDTKTFKDESRTNNCFAERQHLARSSSVGMYDISSKYKDNIYRIYLFNALLRR